jgi:diguanylate cyclase (GGDEF)-like protein
MPDLRIALLRDNCERLLAQLVEVQDNGFSEQAGEWHATLSAPAKTASEPADQTYEYACRLGARFAAGQRPVEELIIQLLQASQPKGRGKQRQQAQQTKVLAAGIRAYLQQLTQQLTERAQRDPLTQLLNRAVFDQRLREELTRAQRYQREFALVLFDLDRFKEINDRLGHPAGDEVLQRFAGFLRSSLRQTDSAFRYGGDEFAALLPETGSGAARQVLERLEQHWLTASCCDLVPWAVRVSYGLAAYPHEALTAAELLQLADTRLYEHKRTPPPPRHAKQFLSEIQQ